MRSPVSKLSPDSVAFPSPATLLNAPPARSTLRYLDMHFDAGLGALWCYLKSDAPVCFTPSLIDELRQSQRDISAGCHLAVKHYDPSRLRYQVMASRIPDIFSLGGDLAHFLELIRARRKADLHDYAREALELVYSSATGHGRSITTISLVRGLALGGGFEAALAADVIVAERRAKMGFPEILFNMFPGMGAYTLLRRRVSHVMAERIILSGATYSAEELHDMGVVDIVADDGQGEAATMDYMRRNQTRLRGRAAFRRALEAAQPLDRRELLAVLDIWVATAMALQEKDLRVMEFLVRNQQRYSERPMDEAVAG